MALFRLPTASLAGLRRAANWSYLLTVAAALLGVVAIALAKPRLPVDLSNLVFDWYQRLDHRAWDPQSPVRIVDIDNDSLARIGQWPWPRSTMADIVTR